MQIRYFIGLECVKIIGWHFNRSSQNPLIVSYHLIMKNSSHEKKWVRNIQIKQLIFHRWFPKEFQTVRSHWTYTTIHIAPTKGTAPQSSPQTRPTACRIQCKTSPNWSCRRKDQHLPTWKYSTQPRHRYSINNYDNRCFGHQKDCSKS